MPETSVVQGMWNASPISPIGLLTTSVPARIIPLTPRTHFCHRRNSVSTMCAANRWSIGQLKWRSKKRHPVCTAGKENEKMDAMAAIDVLLDEDGEVDNSSSLGQAGETAKNKRGGIGRNGSLSDSNNLEKKERNGRKSHKETAVDIVSSSISPEPVVEQDSVRGAEGGFVEGEIESQLRRGLGDADEDEGQPLFVDEEDPEWPAEGEQGWGFAVSDFFKDVKVRNESWEDDGEGEGEGEGRYVSEEYWEEERRFADVTHVEWEQVALQDGSPLVLAVYARYGHGQEEQRQALAEVERMANTIWDAGNAPLRAAKLDMSMELDLASALRVQRAPAVLFLKGGKCHCRIDAEDGWLEAAELVKVAAHVFYGAVKPSSLADLQQRRISRLGATLPPEH